MYRDNSPWDVTKTGIFVHIQQIGKKFFRKKTLNLYVFLSVMQLFVFVLPDESGVRIG